MKNLDARILRLVLVCCSVNVAKAVIASCGRPRCISNFRAATCGSLCTDPCRTVPTCLATLPGRGGCGAGSYCIAQRTHEEFLELAGESTEDPCACTLACFSSNSTAQLEHKGRTLVKDIKVGDKALTSSNDYKLVYTVDHKHEKKETSFLQVYSAGNRAPLELTGSHMVFMHGKKQPIPASALKVGDAIQTSSGFSNVTLISSVVREGLWNPITTDGTIVVDGVYTSAYNVVFESNDNEEADSTVEVAGFKLLSQHEFLHLLMTPYRVFCTSGLSLSSCEARDEYNPYSRVGIYILKFFYEQNKPVQDMMVIAILTLFQLLRCIMHPFAIIIGIISGIYYYTIIAKKMKYKNR